MVSITAYTAGNQLLAPESMRTNLFDYDELLETMIRVLTSGQGLAQLTALADPWEPEAPEVATAEDII